MPPPIRRRALLGPALVAPLVASACAGRGPPTVMAPSDGDYDVLRDLPYGEGPRRTADVYRPRPAPGARAPGPRPLIVYLYGGIWTTGEKGDPISRTLPKDLAERGAVVVVPDYRLWPEATFPGFVEDCAAAVAWARRNAPAWGADPRAVFIAGHSSGAYMALLIGLDRRYLDAVGFGPPPPVGLIGVSGVYEPGLFELRIMRPLFGVSPDRGVILPASHLRPGVAPPPVLLIAGSWDTRVDPGNSTRLGEAVRAAGGEAEVTIYPRVGHLDIISAGPWLSSFAPTADDIADFVRRRAPAPAAPAAWPAAR